MKDLYNPATEKPIKLEDLISLILKKLQTQSIQADRERVLSCLAFLDAKRQNPRSHPSPWEMDGKKTYVPSDSELEFWNAVSDIWDKSEAIRKNLSMPQKDQESLQNALETIQEVSASEIDQSQSEADRLLSSIFTVLPNGGLVPREDVDLTMERGLSAIGVTLDGVGLAKKAQSLCNLRLGDAIMAVEDKFGETVDYTQIMETSGKSMNLARQARMTSKAFPATKRQELDPEGRLTYSHFMNVVDQKLTQGDREALLRFAVKRSTTEEAISSTNLRKMATLIAKLPEEARQDVATQLDEKIQNSSEAVNLLNHHIEAMGGQTTEKPRFLYIGYAKQVETEFADDRHTSEPWQKTTNEYSLDLAMEADLVIRLNPPQIVEGPDTFSDIPFKYISPEILEADPKHPEA